MRACKLELEKRGEEKEEEKNWGSQFTRNPPFISQPNWECKWVLRFPYWAEYLHVDYQLSNLSQREENIDLFECAHFDLLCPFNRSKKDWHFAFFQPTWQDVFCLPSRYILLTTYFVLKKINQLSPFLPKLIANSVERVNLDIFSSSMTFSIFSFYVSSRSDMTNDKKRRKSGT